MKTFKKIIALFLILSGLFGCSLEEQIYDTPMSESLLKSQADVPFLLNGVYSFLSSGNMFKANAMFLYLNGADDIVGSSTTATAFSQKVYTSSTANITAAWETYYQLINNSNKLREAMEPVNMDEAYKKRINGELYFLRGWMYFDLVRFFGGVPIRTEGSNGAGTTFNIPRNSVEEVYALVFDDLKKASVQCVPFSKLPAAESGHATKGAAQGMLALAHLTYGNYFDLKGDNAKARENYALAKSWADSVILSGEYGLINNYADLWDIEKENAAYREVILGVRFSRDPLTAGAASRGSEYAGNSMPATLFGVTGDPANGIGTAKFKVQPWFYDQCATGDFAGDYRTEVSFLTKWVQNGVAGKYRIAYPSVRASAASGETTEQIPYLFKYRDGKGLDGRNHENDLFYMRLAEIYLIKAEAENELNGPTEEAYAAFNKLRARARMANGTARLMPKDLSAGLSKEQFRMKIFDERGLELVGEGHRWFDLVRMKSSTGNRTMMEYILDDYIKTVPSGIPVYNTATNTWQGGKTVATSLPPWNVKYLLYPVSANELNSNPAFGQQNPGW